uniref:Titin n=1 Tax=Astyanax mexicanus TaxID=7994 RepID=A0A8B9H961_ASTMX
MGVGEPAQTADLVEIIEREEIPDLELDVELRRTLVVKAGNSIRLFVPIKGRPTPAVTWSKEDTAVKTRAIIDNTESYTLLVIPDCNRRDAGKYDLTLENAAGKKTAYVNVKVLDSPGPPLNLKPKAIDKESITLQWEMPLIDGGSKITNYIIEKREATRKAYATVVMKCPSCSVRIPNLSEGSEYYFRVSAENEFGIGEAAETSDPIRASQAPTPPQMVAITDVTKNSVSLAWTKSKHDGGSRITGYVLEAQKKGTDQWTHVTTVKSLDFTVKNLNESEEYVFRVMAVNLSGRSLPRESKHVVIREQSTEPEFDLRGICQKTVIAKAGDNIKVEVPVTGRPKPTVSWQKDNQALKLTQRTMVENTSTSSILTMNECLRSDSGVYSVTGKNIVGSVTENIIVKVHDVPGPPKGPIKLDKIARTSIEFSWETPENDGGPEYDGGFKITGYIVEKRDLPAGRWIRANFTNIIETTFTVSGLTKDESYEFRVFARNSAGALSNPSEQSDPITYTNSGLVNKDSLRKDGGEFVLTEYKINVSAMNSEGVGEAAAVPGTPKAEERLIAPEIDLDADLRKIVNIRACNTLRLFVPIRGRPTPEVKWARENDEPLDRATIENTSSFTSLVIGNVNRFDSGKYNLTVENSSGSKTVSVTVRVLDTPGAPQNLKISQVTKESVTLIWEPPINDGGTKIKNYVVEKREATRKAYATVNALCHKTTWTIDQLQEGCNYYFRVLAENEYGIGLPIETGESVKVSEKPLPPRKVILQDVTKTSVTLSWEKPEHDGGSRVVAYVVEIQPKGSDKWSQSVIVKVPEAVISGLNTGEEYMFRVSARNEKGTSDPRQIGVPVIVKDLVIAPSAKLLFSTYTVLAEKDLTIDIPYIARPKAAVSWVKDGAPLKRTSRVNFSSTDTLLSLVIKEATRDDVGKYSIKLSNTAGETTVDIGVVVLDKPGPPSGPVKVEEVTSDSVTISWNPPEYDGGCTINNYLVEKRDTSTTAWAVVATNLARTKVKAGRLKTGTEYQFRISAENRYGKSPLLVSESGVFSIPSYSTGPITAKDEIEPPRISIDPQYTQTIVVNAGDNFKIDADVHGKPVPTIHWMKGDQELGNTIHREIKNTESYASISVKEAKLADGGLYTLLLKNPGGEKGVQVNICVLDKP